MQAHLFNVRLFYSPITFSPYISLSSLNYFYPAPPTEFIIYCHIHITSWILISINFLSPTVVFVIRSFYCQPIRLHFIIMQIKNSHKNGVILLNICFDKTFITYRTYWHSILRLIYLCTNFKCTIWCLQLILYIDARFGV